MWAREGMRVEVKGVEEGFLGSWFGARILKAFKGGAECKVQYDEFVDENDESKPLQETVKTSQLRPVPPSLNVTSWLNKDAVEVYHSHCWWGGIIQNYLASDNKYVVYFRESMEELEIDASKIRTRQDWVQTADQRVFVWQIHTPFTVNASSLSSKLLLWNSQSVHCLILNLGSPQSSLMQPFCFVDETFEIHWDWKETTASLMWVLLLGLWCYCI